MLSRLRRLLSYTARPPAAGGITNGVSVLATAMFSKYSPDHARQPGLGSAGPFFGRTGIAAGRQPFGVDARLCVGGVVIRSCLLRTLLRELAFLQLTSC